MRQFVASSTYFLILIIIISIGVIGFNSFHKNTRQSVNKQGSQQAVINEEVIQVGTDLNIQSLQPISQAYYQHSGVRIEWVPIVTSEQDETAVSNPINSQSGQDGLGLQLDASSTLQTVQLTKPKPLKLVQGLDMVLMHSAYTAYSASENHQLQPLGSDVLFKTIPEQYQDPNGEWFGVSQYARTLVYHKNQVNKAELVNYTVLVADKWFGRVCMTALERPDNQVIAKILQHYRGTANTAEILAGWQHNMGKPAQDDNHVLTQIAQGGCDVGIVNSDSFWQYSKTNPDTPVRLVWANQINKGVSTNTITAAAVKDGDDVGAALAFIEWLISDKGQAVLSFYTSTFPVIELSDADINQQAVRPSWANYEADNTPLATIMADKTIVTPALPKAILPAETTHD